MPIFLFTDHHGGKVLSTEEYSPTSNDLVNLIAIERDPKQLWQKVDEYEDGWIKLKQYTSDLFLQIDKEGKSLHLSCNIKPCKGRKPCLR